MIRMPLYEGECADPEQSNEIGEIIIRSLAPGMLAECPHEITMTSTENGTITVRAVDQINRLENPCEVKLKSVMGEVELQNRTMEFNQARVLI